MVTVETPVDSNIKTFRDARHKRFKSPWYNFNRADAYDVSPYETKVKDGVFLAGDVLLNGSLNAAILAGEKAAMGVLEAVEKIS